MDPLDETASKASSSVHENEVNKTILRWERKHGEARTRFPELVGDIPERAETVVRLETPFYIVTMPYKHETYSYYYHYLEAQSDPLRIIFFLDSNGYIAVTPRCG
jgi:hypothetical protein